MWECVWGGLGGKWHRKEEGKIMGKCPVDSLLTELRDTQRCLSETFREKKKKKTPYFTCLFIPAVWLLSLLVSRLFHKYWGVEKLYVFWKQEEGPSGPWSPLPVSVHMVCLCHWPWYGACVPSSWKAMIPVCLQSFWGPHLPSCPHAIPHPCQTLE